MVRVTTCWMEDSILHYLGVKRAGANLHIGTVYLGCITVSSSCQEQFDDIINFLNAESAAGYENMMVKLLYLEMWLPIN